LNNNLLAVVDVETTGPIAGVNDLIEICVMPLGADLTPEKGTLPFQMELMPMRRENIDFEAMRIQRKWMERVDSDKIILSKDAILDATLKGCEPSRAADLFVEWWENLGLIPFKRIMPIAHNWVFDRSFLIDWLGYKTFDYCFDPRYRDTMGMSLYDNDIADWRSEYHPYPKNNLAYLASQLKVDRRFSHTALDDCRVTAEVYRKMVQYTWRPNRRVSVESLEMEQETLDHTDHTLNDTHPEQ